MTNDKMREEFEAWQTESYSGPLTDPFWLVRDSEHPERYALFEIQSSWRAWQASHDSLLKRQALEQEEFIAHLADFEHEDTFHG